MKKILAIASNIIRYFKKEKYGFTGETKEFNGITLKRIRAIRDFGSVKAGTIGGWIEREFNLSHFDEAWVSDEAWVHGNAIVSENAIVGDEAWVHGNAIVSDNADYIEFKNWWSSGRYFTWTRSNDMWSVGCFFGTGDELVNRAYGKSDVCGREYERIVKHVNEIQGR